MNSNELSFDSLDSCLVDLQIGEATLDLFSLSLLRTHGEDEADVGEGNGETETSKSVNENVSNTGEEKTKSNDSKGWCLNSSPDYSVKSLPVFPTSVPFSHDYLMSNEGEMCNEDLIYVEDTVPVSRDRVRRLQGCKLSFPELTPELSELPFQHSEFPPTPRDVQLPCTWSTPILTSERENRDTCSRYDGPFDERPLDFPGTSPSSLCQSSGASLPSIMSWGVGGGEGPCSSISQLSAAWASSSSTCGSEKTVASPYIMPSSRRTEWSQSCEETSNLNKEFYHFKNYKSCSYPEVLNQQNMTEAPTAHSGESALTSGNYRNVKCEFRRSRNRIFPYPANKSYPVIASTGRRFLEGEALRLKKEDILQRFQRKHHQPGSYRTASPSAKPGLEVEFLNSSIGNPTISIALPQAKKSSAVSVPFNLTESRLFSVKEVCRISPRKALLQKVVYSTLAFRSHPLFPLLRDLVVAERNYDTAALHISSVLQYLPSSTGDLISTFLCNNPDNAYTYRTSNNISNAIESVIRDVIIYAHRCLLEKLESQGTKMSPSAAEGVKEADLEKNCLRYLDALRSSTPLPVLQTICFNSPRVAKGNSLMFLDEMLEPFSPIPSSLDV